MRKFVALLLAAVMMVSMLAIASAEDMQVALITDVGTITDQSFNQTTYEAAKAYCDSNNVKFTYYQPATDTDADRIAMIDKAVDEGFNVILMPGYKFGPAIGQVQEEYSDIKFIALDVSAGDLGGNEPASNVYCAVYQEELCGYMAGYAAVKLGYTHLGFLGGMAVPAVVRYGFGFVQGADAAAAETGADVTVEYVYGNQFYGDADITAYMDNWYQTLGVQVVFACGGGIYSSAAEAAVKVDGAKVIGVDVDQAAQIDTTYNKEGLTVTSAMKGLGATVNTLLQAVVDGKWDEFGGKVDTLGLVGEDPDANYVQIAPSTQFSDSFTVDDYKALVAKMFAGEITVSNAIDAMPSVSITVNDRGTVK
jgi:basic membrane protein A